MDDLAEACVFLMNHNDGTEILNVGVGKDISIRDLTHLVAKVVGYEGDVRFDETKLDGTPQKLLDVSRLRTAAGCAKISLERRHPADLPMVFGSSQILPDERRMQIDAQMRIAGPRNSSMMTL